MAQGCNGQQYDHIDQTNRYALVAKKNVVYKHIHVRGEDCGRVRGSTQRVLCGTGTDTDTDTDTETCDGPWILC